MNDETKEELCRRLAQSRRLTSSTGDALTRERLQALISEPEQQIAAAEARDTDAPG